MDWKIKHMLGSFTTGALGGNELTQVTPVTQVTQVT